MFCNTAACKHFSHGQACILLKVLWVKFIWSTILPLAGFTPGKVWAQVITWIEGKGLEDAKLQQVGVGIMRWQVGLRAAVKDDMN